MARSQKRQATRKTASKNRGQTDSRAQRDRRAFKPQLRHYGATVSDNQPTREPVRA